MSTSHDTICKVIVDGPASKDGAYSVSITDVQTQGTYQLPHTITMKNRSARPVVFHEAVDGTFATLTVGSNIYTLNSSYPKPLKAYNQTSSSTTTSSGSLAIPFIIGASSSTEEMMDYIYIGPEKDKPKSEGEAAESTE